MPLQRLAAPLPVWPMADKASPFNPRAMLTLAAVSGGAFVIALFVGILASDRLAPPTAGNNAFSESALGHQALVELFEETGLPVHIIRDAVPIGLSSRHLLVIVEPSLDYLEQFLDQLHPDDRFAILIVLPKREGYVEIEGDRWISASRILPISEVEPFLDLLGIDGSFLRPPAGAEITKIWSSTIDSQPEIADLQIIRSDDLGALLSGEQGILLGRVKSQTRNRTYVLSDPDLIANHGLDDGDNAILMVRLAHYFVGDKGIVLIDAAAHGFGRRADLWQLFFKPPLVVVTLQLLALAAVLLLIGWRRLGPVAAETSRMPAGSVGLIETMSGWLTAPNRRPELMQAYLDVASHDRRRRAGKPAKAGFEPLQDAVAQCQPGMAEHRAVRLAQSINAWRRGNRRG